MKYTYCLSYLLLLVLTPIFIEAQVIDDFSDGDFSSSPTWSGDESEFEVDEVFQLHLNAPAVENESYLSTPSAAIENAQWDIKMTLAFNPSSANRAYIYLVSDVSDLEGDLNGYFVMIGNTADEVSLYRQSGGTSTKIIDGLDGLLSVDPLNLSIRVLRDDVGNWELLSDLDNTGTYTSEGTVLDDTYTTSSYFGLLCDYTSTRSTSFFFDDVVVTGTGVTDIIPPNISSILVVDAMTLEVNFSEPVDPITAESVANYTWLPFSNPNAAVLNGQTVTLTFDSSFPENESQTLQVESVTDIAGNSIGSVTEEFTYFVIVVAAMGDVIINELMSDPNPVLLDLPDAEYIELYNASESAYDLAGWNLRNTTTDKFLGSYILSPGAYVIICASEFESAFEAYGDVLSVATFTALTNSGDDLYLFNPDGLLIDEVTYSLSWYGGGVAADGGYSLERKNPFLPCSSASNWTASTDSNGGTPGTVNSVFIAGDIIPPTIVNVSILDNSTLLLQFSESMDELSLIISQYFLSSFTVIAQSPTDPTQVMLDVEPALTAGQSYDLIVSGPTDCTGNTMLDTTLTFFIPEDPEAGDIIFNEIMADPSPVVGLPDVEYIELYNRSTKILQLEGWNLVNTSTDNFLGNQVMLPGDYVILCHVNNAAVLSGYGTVLGLTSFSTLSNDGDDLYLIDPEGEEIDAVSYTSEWYRDSNKDDGGYSLELINPELPCSNFTNWKASEALIGGTPGTVNASLDLSPDVSAPYILSATPLSNGQQIQIVFSEPLDAGSIQSGDFEFEPDVEIVGIIVDQSSVLIVLDGPLIEGQIYTISISDLADCSGNTIVAESEVLTALPIEAQANDLVINEVLFNPRTGGVDFVEIYNRSPRPISLKNWKMANRSMGELASVSSTTSSEFLILPGEFKVFTEDRVNIINNYPMGVFNNFLEIADLPSYNDDEGYVVLLNPSVEVHDEFYYNEDYQFALIDILDGVSLERIDYDRLTNDPTNWHSAAEKVGYATPGYENSQLQPSNATSDAFSVEPDVFSPDNDGEADILNINYLLDAPGSVANIRIYDRDGRLIRLLVRNELLATRGTISWDGITDEGTKARIGVYIILIELFDLQGNTSSTKKSCVLGGRL